MAKLKTPEVYIQETNNFSSVVPVPTAVPAFIGYTPQAMYEGKSYLNVPMKISSFAEFQVIFCFPNPSTSVNPIKQYEPQYYLVKQNSLPSKGDYILIGNNYYSIVPDPSTIYYFYNSIRLFYENGGGDAYIVSIGSYGVSSGIPITLGDQIVNSNVLVSDLINGLAVLKNEQEPTMYICPEATLLSLDNNATLMQAMLSQCSEMQTAISIFDIIGGRNPDPILYTQDIENFRNSTGTNGLSYGAVYYPFIGTSIMRSNDIDYTNLFDGDIKQLEPLLNPATEPNSKAAVIISNIENPQDEPLTISEYNNALIVASPTYSTIVNHILSEVNMLPPSGGMAGVITTVDNQIGPWQSPANLAMAGAIRLPIELSASQQITLNVDAISGKSINAIRTFIGSGILIWGARTLDGNSLDWKYISVRRTLIFIEQSCKLAVQAYVFDANDKNTWVSVKATLDNFLIELWKQGGLAGTSPSDAFCIECGLGITMTPADILEGFMRITIKVAPIRPAEFIVITFLQQMVKSS